MKRAFNAAEPELMDVPQPESPELEACLRNLGKINYCFGSHHLIRKFLRAWLSPGRCYRILDLATGFGDIPRMTVEWARPRRISLRIDAVDSNPATLSVARRWSRNYSEISYIQGDARTYADQQTYDLVCCSLALHHFSDDDAVKLLRHMRDLSHDKILVTDLERNSLNWLSVYLLTTVLFREPMTRHDGRVSIERAFSYTEMDRLAAAAGWDHYSHRRFIPARQAVWMSAREEGHIFDFGLPAASEFATGC